MHAAVQSLQLEHVQLEHIPMCTSGTDDAAWALCCTVALHPFCPDRLSMVVPLPTAGSPAPSGILDGDELLRHLVQEHGWD